MDLVSLPFLSAVFHRVSLGHLSEPPLLLDPLMQSDDDLKLFCCHVIVIEVEQFPELDFLDEALESKDLVCLNRCPI